MKILVSFSGGKDSQACLIQSCEVYGRENITAVFCDTGWEHHLTLEHVENVVRELDVPLVVLRREKGGFEQLCRQMKWFPDSQHRMCTVQLKIQPMIDYILSIDDDVIIIQGIRAAESKSRSQMSCSGLYFQEYLKPTSRTRRLYRVNDVRAWMEKHKAYVERPMFGVSSQNVIDYILDKGMQPNPLYRLGFSRVGCFPCIYARLADVKAMRSMKEYVKRCENLENDVNEIRRVNFDSFNPASIFSKGKIPERFCYKYGKGIPAFEDVIKYVSRDDTVQEIFENDEAISCMSVYHGLCE